VSNRVSQNKRAAAARLWPNFNCTRQQSRTAEAEKWMEKAIWQVKCEVRAALQLARCARAEAAATQPQGQTLSLFLVLQVHPLIDARALAAAGYSAAEAAEH
jgi:hypothetical protein